MNGLLAVLIAYLLGAIPFGYLLVKWRTGRDVRAGGSGNIGATNVLRTSGRAAGIATLLLDVVKGYLAVWFAGCITAQSPGWMSLAALAVMAGHIFPVFLGFKGGKAVASFAGAFLCLTPLALMTDMVVFIVMVLWTRRISIGSITAAASFPLAVWLILHPPAVVTAAAIVAGALIIYRHSNNVRRIRAGTEDEFTFGAHGS